MAAVREDKMPLHGDHCSVDGEGEDVGAKDKRRFPGTRVMKSEHGQFTKLIFVERQPQLSADKAIPLYVVVLVERLGKHGDGSVDAVIDAIPIDRRSALSGTRIKLRAKRNVQLISVPPAEIEYTEMTNGPKEKRAPAGKNIYERRRSVALERALRVFQRRPECPGRKIIERGCFVCADGMDRSSMSPSICD